MNVETLKAEAAQDRGGVAYREFSDVLVRCTKAGDAFEWRAVTTAEGPGRKITEREAAKILTHR